MIETTTRNVLTGGGSRLNAPAGSGCPATITTVKLTSASRNTGIVTACQRWIHR